MTDTRVEALRSLCDAVLHGGDEEGDVADLLLSGRTLAAEALRLLDERDMTRSTISRLLTSRNEVEYVLGDGWKMRDQLWSYVPESDAELELLTQIIGCD